MRTTEEMFSTAKERLDDVYDSLGYIYDLLRSDCSTRLTEREADRVQLMLQEVLKAQQAVENAKSGRVR